MNPKEGSTTKIQVRASRNQIALKRSANGLLIVAAVVYGAGAILLVAAPIAAVVAWGILAAVAGLAALAFLASAAPAVGPVIASRWHHSPARHLRDEWCELWEELILRPVR